MSTLDTLGFSLMIQRRGESNPELSAHFSIHYDHHDILINMKLGRIIQVKVSKSLYDMNDSSSYGEILLSMNNVQQ